MNPPHCLYCKGTAFIPLWEGVRDRLGFVPGAWEFLRCRGCGSALLHPQPNPEALASFYPPVYDLTPAQMQSGSRPQRFLAGLEYRWFFKPQYQAQARKIRRLAGSSSPRLLEIGCGGGLRLLAWKKAGFEVTGADFREKVVEELLQEGIPALAVDARRLNEQLKAESYDIITAFHLLEHLSDVRAVLQAAHQGLQPGGHLVVTIPMMESFQAALFGARWSAATEAPRHLSIPSRKGIHHLLTKVGFQSISFQPDVFLNNLGVAVLSAVPVLGKRHLDGAGQNGIPATLLPLAAAGAGLLLLPLCAAERLLNRSAIVMVTARKK